MKQIRRSVFETNSSSVHSLTILPEDEFEKFKNGEMLWDAYDDKLVTKEEALKEIQKDYPEVTLESVEEEGWSSYDYRTYKYWTDSEYETFKQSYTTKSGDKIVAFGYYGYN